MERRKGQPKVAARLPPPLVLLGLGEVAGPPLSLSPPQGVLFQLGLVGGGGILLPEGVGLHPNPSWTRIPRGGKRERGAGHLS